MPRRPSANSATRPATRRRSTDASQATALPLPNQVILRTPTSEFALDVSKFDKGQPSLAREAMRWTYTLRSRRRWSESETDASVQTHDAADFLRRFGAGMGVLAELAKAGVVEVDIPWSGV